MAEELYTGAWLLRSQDQQHSHGMIGAFGPPDGPGTVRLTLPNRGLVSWEADDGDVTIELSEQLARQLAEQLAEVIVRLEHLRELARMPSPAG